MKKIKIILIYLKLLKIKRISGQVISEVQHLNQLNCVVHALKKIRIKQFNTINQKFLSQIYSSSAGSFNDIVDYIDNDHEEDQDNDEKNNEENTDVVSDSDNERSDSNNDDNEDNDEARFNNSKILDGKFSVHERN